MTYCKLEVTGSQTQYHFGGDYADMFTPPEILRTWIVDASTTGNYPSNADLANGATEPAGFGPSYGTYLAHVPSSYVE
jgi:hypothetical protein